MDHVGGILLTAAETLFFGAVVEGVVGNGISKLAKRHPRDEKWLAQVRLLKDFTFDKLFITFSGNTFIL
jgi:hypothetical protein